MSVTTFSPNDVEIQMTEKAIKHFRRQLKEKAETAVRLSVRESGCSGFMYEMDFVESAQDTDKQFIFEDVIVYVSKEALPIMQGTEIDYTTEGVNSVIQFNNPNAKATCGCGESFTL